MALATLVLADLSLSVVIWWLVVGLIAGFLASVVMRGGGYGVVGDILVAFIGACILIAILRAVSGGLRRRTS
jgi:uncharacterized membrane protein YeaQ/YmgE (transglycosylase-associated protein family)